MSNIFSSCIVFLLLLTGITHTYQKKQSATDLVKFSNLSSNPIICISRNLFFLPSQMELNIIRKALPIRRSLDNKRKIGTEL